MYRKVPFPFLCSYTGDVAEKEKDYEKTGETS